MDKKGVFNGYVIPTGRNNEGFLSLFPKIKQVQAAKLTLSKLLPLALCVNKFHHTLFEVTIIGTKVVEQFVVKRTAPETVSVQYMNIYKPSF